jgi:hypothetical protein
VCDVNERNNTEIRRHQKRVFSEHSQDEMTDRWKQKTANAIGDTCLKDWVQRLKIFKIMVFQFVTRCCLIVNSNSKDANGAVPWLRMLDTSLSPQRPRFDPRPDRVGFVVYKVVLGRIFLRTSVFPWNALKILSGSWFIHVNRKVGDVRDVWQNRGSTWRKVHPSSWSHFQSLRGVTSVWFWTDGPWDRWF